MREQEIDARVVMAQTALNQHIEHMYEAHGAGVMNLVVMETIPALAQTVLLFYPDPEAHQVIKDTLLEMLGDTLLLVDQAEPLSDDELDTLASSVPKDTIN